MTAARSISSSFVAFTDIPMASLVDRVLPVAEVFGVDGAALEAAVIAEEDDGRAIDLELVRGVHRHPDGVAGGSRAAGGRGVRRRRRRARGRRDRRGG